MSEVKIKIKRSRAGEFTVNFPANGGYETYKFVGSKLKGIDDIKELPKRVVDYLIMNSTTFTEGHLTIVKDGENENKEEVKKIFDAFDDDILKTNTHTKDEIIQILEGNFMKMKKELGLITIKEEKSFVVDVAKELKIDSSAKRSFVSEWAGISEEMIFDKE